MKKLFCVLIILVTACTTAQPEPTTYPAPTETPFPPTATFLPTSTPTETLIPLVDLTGSLFFDYNGNGVWDVSEPLIDGFGVCAKADQQEWSCTKTDEQGHFIFESIGPEGAHLLLKFEDPNAGDPAVAFRYINLWYDPVVIEAYEMNGVIVPEQHLNDTKVLQIDEVLGSKAGEDIELGLMQGLLRIPFSTKIDFFIVNFFDLDNSFCQPGSDPHKCPNVRDWRGKSHTYDGEGGMDYVTNKGTVFLASAEGKVKSVEYEENSGNFVVLDHGNGIVTYYRHANTILVKEGEKVFSGSVIGLVGNTGNSSTPHLHFEMHINGIHTDHYRDLFSNDSISYWTKDNDPQYP